MMDPLLSIVIANYNYGRFLEAAILSVVNQHPGDEVELIICDAASTDNSVDVIRKYAGDLPPNTARDDLVGRDDRYGVGSAARNGVGFVDLSRGDTFKALEGRLVSEKDVVHVNSFLGLKASIGSRRNAAELAKHLAPRECEEVHKFAAKNIGVLFEGARFGFEHEDRKAQDGQRWVKTYFRVFAPFVFGTSNYLSVLTLRKDQGGGQFYSIEAIELITIKNESTQVERTPRGATPCGSNSAPLQPEVLLTRDKIAHYVGDVKRTRPRFIGPAASDPFSVDEASRRLLALVSCRRILAWWCSEKDGGQSAAFNKGFAHARGKYLTWLNADDVMPDGCLAKIIGEMKCHPDCEWFTGNFYRFTQDGRVIEVGWGPHWYPAFLQSPHAPLVIFGPTTFFSKKIYEQVGKIDESLHYIMDNDLWYRFMVAGIKQRRINCFCWGFRMHEESKTAQFGEHALEKSVADKMNAERDYLLRKSGYTQSKFLRYFLLLLRVFDGSLLYRFWLKKTFKKMRVT